MTKREQVSWVQSAVGAASPHTHTREGFNWRESLKNDNSVERCEPMYALPLFPDSEISRRPASERDGFFAELPAVFTRQQLLALAKIRKYNENTVLSWLRRLVKKGTIQSVDGGYRKSD